MPGSLTYPKPVLDPLMYEFCQYCNDRAAARYGDREGWIKVSILHQNWAKDRGMDAHRFKNFLGCLASLELGRFDSDKRRKWRSHPEMLRGFVKG